MKEERLGNQCTGRVLSGLSSDYEGNNGWNGNGDDTPTKQELVQRINNMYVQGVSTLVCTTNHEQESAEELLEWMGFNKSKPMTGKRYGNTITLWWYAVQDQFDPKEERYQEYLKDTLEDMMVMRYDGRRDSYIPQKESLEEYGD
jgi:hypothetical protein